MSKIRYFLIAASMLALPLSALAQQVFEQPEQAAQALVKAIADNDSEALKNILGDDWRQYLPEDSVEQTAVDRFLRDWQVSHHIEQQGDSAYLNVGDNNWQLPLPMVKIHNGWSFDMQKAADEIDTRHIGRNELSAIGAMSAFVDAQKEYWAHGMNQYAQKIISSDGKKDGLYWPVKEGEAPSPLGPAFGQDHPGTDYHGYYYRILSAQGASAKGGELSYLDNGKMTKGFAMLAWPVAYGHSGIMSFMVNQDGVVYQRDLGVDSDALAGKISLFDPDKNWQVVQSH